MLIQDIFGWIAAFSSTVIFAYPAIQFINVLKGSLNYEDTPIFLIGTIYINCLTWYAYGYYIFSPQVKICNIIGCCFSLFCSIIYLTYESKKFLTDTILNTLILFAGTWAAYRTYFVLLGDDNVVGKVCIITSLISLLHPLYLIYRVIREKNYKLISLIIARFTIISGVCWVIYGFIDLDYYIVCLNLLNIFVAIAQIIIVKKFKLKYPTIEQATTQISTIEIESIDDNSKKQGSGEIKIDVGNEEESEKIKVKPVKIATKK